MDALVAFGWGEPVAAAFAAVRPSRPRAWPGRRRGPRLVRRRWRRRRGAGGRRRTLPVRCRRRSRRVPGGRRLGRRSRRGWRRVIQAVLPRRTSIVRHAPGRRTVAQVVAANVDVVFVVASLNQDLNLRRLERYLAVAWESGAEPVVVLSKADLADDLDGTRRGGRRCRRRRAGRDGLGRRRPRRVDAVRDRIPPGATVAFIGSSGVGKSTLLNVLAGDELAAVKDIREDDARGRHTTTRRQLHLLPGGGLVLDTPGMRELALWDADAGLERSFADIEALAGQCRFSDCAHDGEPGCAVAAAIEDGDLASSRFDGWRKLEREARHLERRVDALARAEERRRWKTIHKSVDKHMELKYGREGR